MENAIQILENEIILLTGKIAYTEDQSDITRIAKDTVIRVWAMEIEGLREAQRVLSES